MAAVVARAATLLATDPWFDELYSLYAASGQFGDVWPAAVADRVHPPGFYFVLWGWLALAPATPLGLRLLPFAGWLAMLAAFWWLGRRAGLDRLRILALVALAAVNPVLFGFGALLRGYSLLVAALAVAIGAALSPPEDERRPPWLLLAAVVAATWLHYFAWPVVAAIALGLSLQRRWRDAVLAALIPVALFVPWVVAIARSDAAIATVGASLSFITRPGWWELLTIPGPLIAAMTGLTALIVAIICYEALARWPERHSRLMLVLAALLPIVMAFVATRYTPLRAWGTRYLAVVLPAFLLALVAQTRVMPRVGAIYLGLFLGSGVLGVLAPESRPTPWRAVAERVDRDDVAVYANEGFVILPLRYQAVIGHARLTVTEVRGMPPAGAPPGWIVLRPAMLPDGYQPADALQSMGRAVTDSFAMGEGWLAVKAWRFE